MYAIYENWDEVYQVCGCYEDGMDADGWKFKIQENSVRMAKVLHYRIKSNKPELSE